MPIERIAPNDAIWLQDSPTNPMVINAVIITDHLDVRTVRTTFRRRVFEGRDAAAFERFRCRVGGRGRRRTWERDPDFDLRRHIIPARVKRLEGPEAVQDYVGKEASRGLDPDHPLWQVQVIPGLGGDATVILVRIHHSLGDGEALMGLLLALADTPPDPGGTARPGRPAQDRRPSTSLLKLASIAMSAPGILLRRLTWTPDRNPMHGPRLSGNKRVAWTRALDLDVVKRANRHIGATVNDVLMASVSGAFSHYLLDHGGAAPSRFLVSMPVSVRALAKSLRCGNYFAPVPLELPAGASVNGHRILAVKTRMDRLKGSPEPLVIYHLQRALLALLPNPLSRFIIDFLANKCSAVVTNVKGPAHDITLQGRRVRSLMFWVPQRARIGIGISILSFSGKVHVGVITDAALVPDPAGLIRAFEDEFETLEMLAALEPGPAGAPEAGLRAPEPGIRRPARRKAKPKATPRPDIQPLPEPDAVPSQEILPTLIAADPAGLPPVMEADPVDEEPVLV